MPWRARDFVHGQLRWWVGRPQLKRDPLGEHATFERTTISFKPIAVFLATWALTGLGAVIGSVLGHGAGKPGLFAGAVVGGVLGVGAAVVALTKLQWLPAADRRGAFVGGIAGFAVAAPIAVRNLGTPVTLVLACALASVGLLLGVGMSRGWRRLS